jgi:hypothetical protein
VAAELEDIEAVMIGGQWQEIRRNTLVLHDAKGPMWAVPTVTFHRRPPAEPGQVECPLYLVEGVRYATNTAKQ